MADATTNTTADAFGRGNSNGYIADIAALGGITTAKDVSAQLVMLANRQNDDHNALNLAIAGNNLATVTARADVVNAIAQNAGVLGVQAEKIASDSQVQAERIASAGTLQAEKLASASVLLATQLAAINAKQLAEGFCDVKSKVDCEADRTRALISDLARRDADRRETDLKIELSNCRQTGAIDRMLDDKFRHEGHGHHGRCAPMVPVVATVPASAPICTPTCGPICG